jgi:hypothetical protein
MQRKTHWSQEENDYLTANWTTARMRTLATDLHRHKNTIYLQAKKLGLSTELRWEALHKASPEAKENRRVGRMRYFTQKHERIFEQQKLEKEAKMARELATSNLFGDNVQQVEAPIAVKPFVSVFEQKPKPADKKAGIRTKVELESATGFRSLTGCSMSLFQ